MRVLCTALRLPLMVLALDSGSVTPVLAQSAGVVFAMRSQSHADSLAALTRLCGATLEIVQGVYGQLVVREVPPVRTVEEALDRLLAGKGLGHRRTAPGRYRVIAAGVDAATRGAAETKDVAKSLSVVTRQQLDDQRLKRIEDVMLQTPSITVTAGQDDKGSNLETQFYSRGFESTDYSIDGSAPISLCDGSTGLQSQFKPLFDMSVYDRVKILRGANGAYGALGGGPGEVASLQRKRPRNDFYWGVEAETQSHGGLRISAEHSRPLREDGVQAGRFVVTRELSHFFYDPAWLDKRIVFANIEARLSPDSSISAGFSVCTQRSPGTAPGRNCAAGARPTAPGRGAAAFCMRQC